MPASSAMVSVTWSPTRSVQNVAPCLRYCVFWTPDAVFVAISATGTSVLYQRESPRGPAGDAAPGPSSTPCACGLGGREACYFMASLPRSPVRVRTASSTGVTKILPSPIWLLLSEATMALTMRSTSSSNTTISTFILGWKRYSWALTSSPRVKPFCFTRGEDVKANEYRFHPKMKVEMVVFENDVERIVSAIVASLKSNQIGEGKIFVTPVDDAVRTRTGERGSDAMK